MKPALRTFLMCICFLAFSGCASLSDIHSLEQRIRTVEAENNHLKAKVQDLSAEMDRQREMYASQDAELYHFKEELQKLNGRLNETVYNFNQEKQAWDKSMQSLRETLGRPPGSLESMNVPGSLQPISPGPGGSVITPSEPAQTSLDATSEEELYRMAKDAYDQKNFEVARQCFQKFLELYPKSNIADNARFWIGEAYFSEGWYQKAIVEYQEVIEKFPKGNKVPAAYLKQGISFFKLGEYANAKLVLNELIKRFPQSTEADAARQQLKQIP